MTEQREEEFTLDRTRQLWQLGVGRRKSIPKRHLADNTASIPESSKRLCVEEEEEGQDECYGCQAKQSDNSQLKREVAQLLRLTEYQQDEIERLKKDLEQARRRNDDLQKRVIDKMDHLAVIVTNSNSISTPPRESPRPSSPTSQHLNIHHLAQSPCVASPALSSSPHDRAEGSDQVKDEFSSRLGIHPDRLDRFLETKDSKTISQFTKDIAVCMFGRDTLATHSLKGQMSTAHHKTMLEVKPALPAERVEALIEFVLHVYPATERKIIKSSLREKLNDESKLMKKRLQKEMGQNVSQVMLINSRQGTVKREPSSMQYADEY